MMRDVLLVMLLLAQPSGASECLRADYNTPGSPVVLRGIIEYRYETTPQLFGSRATILHLTSPICVQGYTEDGRVFKHENLTSIRLGIPGKLLGELQRGDRVELRGIIWAPMNGEDDTNLLFAVADILMIS
jgi:hypothetical protein